MLHPNTELGTRAIKHYRREKEAEAAEWDLAQSVANEDIGKPKVRQHRVIYQWMVAIKHQWKQIFEYKPVHVRVWQERFLILVIVSSIGLMVILPFAALDNQSAEEPVASEVEKPYPYSGKGSSGTDRMPMLDLAQ